MEWRGDFPDDHAFVELLVPGVSSDLDFEQLLKDTEEKLNLNASRSVRATKRWSYGDFLLFVTLVEKTNK